MQASDAAHLVVASVATQALLCLARRRADVLFAMRRDGTFYESRPATSG
ncbi:hypothetical protein [Streptomyces sp. NPDC059371]